MTTHLTDTTNGPADMSDSRDYYTDNPQIHKQRSLAAHTSPWVQSFDCTHLRPLIICRGPIRKEAMDVFDEMGIHHYGILLSEKDSIVYQSALAPELRKLTDRNRVHRVPDYSGADKAEREVRIRQIINIAHSNGYNAIFTGYGFMAEDENMVKAMEQAGLNFIGPCSRTVHDAGLKDEAKRTALRVGVSVTPGVDNASALTLLKKHPDVAALQALVAQEALAVDGAKLNDSNISLVDKADLVLAASYAKGIDLYSIAELGETIREQVIVMSRDYPANRIRLKAIGGGGGKGQRILASPDAYEGDLESRLQQAAAKAPSLVLEILNEVKTTGKGDNKNVLVELNIETTRHQEIQVIGNGNWALAMGGRDCSLQMHEQKLLEVSVISEDLEAALSEANRAGNENEIKVLSQDIKTLQKMEEESERFAQAVGLDSVSTFECIVDRDKHFFMEMNTRIQVEHRVTELCYGLRFTNPDNSADFFDVESLVEAMVLLAAHGPRLPKPTRQLRNLASVEARLNATNQALQPHAGGVIEKWSDPVAGEIRDDQGISMHNPDTGVFIKYHLAGAYDSNIALLLTTGQSRADSYQRLAEILRVTELRGKDLATNLEFHYGLVNWFIGNNIHARPTTRFIVPYLTAVGLLKQAANSIDLQYAYQSISKRLVAAAEADDASWAQVLEQKQLLLSRPVETLLAQPHLLAGWLSLNQKHVALHGDQVVWQANPIEVLAQTYHFLNMDYCARKPAANMIWQQDDEILQQALSFYQNLTEKLGPMSFADLDQLLKGAAPAPFDASQWQSIQAAHRGYQAGTELLSLPMYLGHRTGYFDLSVNSDLTIHIPEQLADAKLQAAMAKVLVPPPTAKSDEILALSGGMFYAREAPGMEPFVTKGAHFNAGEPLYIVEVMKMFNKVNAPFAGTIEEVLVVDDGAIIKKGQPLFKITPDEVLVEESAADARARLAQGTDAFLQTLKGVGP